MTFIATPRNPVRVSVAMLGLVAIAGLAGGMAAFVYAMIVEAAEGRGFVQVWQAVASGLVGTRAFQLGWASATLGLVTHFVVAMAMAGAYVALVAKAPSLNRRPITAGALYGATLYLVMCGVVLPLRFSEAYPRADGILPAADLLAHIGLGVSLALVVRQGGRGRIGRGRYARSA